MRSHLEDYDAETPHVAFGTVGRIGAVVAYLRGHVAVTSQEASQKLLLAPYKPRQPEIPDLQCAFMGKYVCRFQVSMNYPIFHQGTEP